MRWPVVSLCVLVAVAVGAAPTSAKVKTKVFSSGDLATPIPDIGPAPVGATSDIRVPKQGRVKDVNVRVRLDHPFAGDLRVFVRDAAKPTDVSPALSLENGGAGDDFGTGSNDCSGTFAVFDDEAATPITDALPPFVGSFRPEGSLSSLDNQKMRGPWQLSVIDVVPGNAGIAGARTLGCWQLEITYRKKKKRN